jgi:hypothetical protein
MRSIEVRGQIGRAITWYCALSLVLVTSWLFGEETPSSESTFTIVQNGRPACSIVIGEHPTPAARLASLELQYHLLRISGVEVAIRTEGEAIPGPRILVGGSSLTRHLGFRSADFKPQEYLIAFRPNTIVLMGRDWEDTDQNRRVQGRFMSGESLQETRQSLDYWKTVGLAERSIGMMELPGSYDDQGTCQATYDFLERFCGVRWYGPGESTVIIPAAKTVRAGGEDIRRAPALKHRGALVSGSWPFLQGQWGQFSREQLCLHWRRLRLGGERWADNHTFFTETIKTLFTNPVYQCQNPSGRGSQLCYSSPQLVSQVVQMARDYFDGKGSLPVGWKAAGDYFAIVPDDNINLCKCGACDALLKQGAGRKTGFFSSGEMSDYWFSFVNAVAREVRQTHPKKFIATLGYWNYAVPPSFALEPNVSISPCLHTCYAVHPEMRENDLKLYRAWRQQAKAPMFLWVYYHHPMEAALIGRWKCFPNVMVHATAKAMQMFIQDGVRGIFECGEQDQLEQYVMAKVWDDPRVDVDGLIEEFFRLYFGAAGEPMKQFYLTLESIACDPSNYPAPYHQSNGIDWKGVAWEQLGTAERMENLGGLITQAEKLAATDLEKQRVVAWRKAIWDWMRQGREDYLAKPK